MANPRVLLTFQADKSDYLHPWACTLGAFFFARIWKKKKRKYAWAKWASTCLNTDDVRKYRRVSIYRSYLFSVIAGYNWSWVYLHFGLYFRFELNNYWFIGNSLLLFFYYLFTVLRVWILNVCARKQFHDW